MEKIILLIYILFLPGFSLSHSFFKGKEIDLAERIGLSIVLSLSLISFMTFYLYLVGVKVKKDTIIIEAGLIIIIGLLFYFVRLFINRKNSK
ncbi:DUF1616 domain-containing protein [Candidatus Roizmanbacteria bacterium]|nr:DUF1616 domain-containing protein [Candidatus Roizmanbacteria bacterium]